MSNQNQLHKIDPTKIKLNDDKIENSIFRNARTTLKKEEMSTNRESIRQLGLLKPIIVRPLQNDPDGYPYQLVCGSRRLRNILFLIREAIGILKENRPFTKEELCYSLDLGEWHPATKVYEYIPCFIRNCDDETAIAINIAENLEHSRLPDVDLIEFCKELSELKNPDGSYRYTRTQIAKLCNRSESWISQTIDLSQLSDRIKQMLYDERITRSAAITFLQTQKDKIDEVIDVSENIVRQEKLQEAKEAEKELELAQIELSDTQNDILIHQMMGNTALKEMAEKREKTNRKRVSAASEKKDKALKEAEAPKLTANVINKANLIVKGAKKPKMKPKIMAEKDIKTMHIDYKNYMKDQEIDTFGIVNTIFETILGHHAYTNMQDLIGKYFEDIDEPPIISAANE